MLDFFLYINMGTAIQLLNLITIFKMAAELCKGVFPIHISDGADTSISSSVRSMFLARLVVYSCSIVMLLMPYLVDDGVWRETGTVETESLVGDVMSRPFAQNVDLKHSLLCNTFLCEELSI